MRAVETECLTDSVCSMPTLGVLHDKASVPESTSPRQYSPWRPGDESMKTWWLMAMAPVQYP